MFREPRRVTASPSPSSWPSARDSDFTPRPSSARSKRRIADAVARSLVRRRSSFRSCFGESSLITRMHIDFSSILLGFARCPSFWFPLAPTPSPIPTSPCDKYKNLRLNRPFYPPPTPLHHCMSQRLLLIPKQVVSHALLCRQQSSRPNPKRVPEI